MTVSRGDRPYGSFPGDAVDQPAPAPAPVRRGVRQRLHGLYLRTQRLQMLVLVLAVCAWTLSAMTVSPRLTQQDLDDAVLRALASATPSPPLAIAIHEHVRHSVVAVSARTVRDGRVDRANGSGVLIDTAGTLLTSLHVIQGADEILVTFSDGTTVNASVVGTLPERDIAALRVTRLPAVVIPATLGDPRSLRVGETAFVVGNPFGLDRSLTEGVISGLERSFTIPSRPEPLAGLIQFDAAVNPGSSGGPLVDRRGDVVGIVTGLVNPSGQSVFSGVGFAVPIDVAAAAAGQPLH